MSAPTTAKGRLLLAPDIEFDALAEGYAAGYAAGVHNEVDDWNKTEAEFRDFALAWARERTGT